MDGAESWHLANESMGWSPITFREAAIAGDKYIVANDGAGFILTRLMAGGTWQRIKAPGGMPPNMELSVVITAGKTEVFVCIAGGIYYGALDTATTITWTGPITSMLLNGSSTKNSCNPPPPPPPPPVPPKLACVLSHHHRYPVSLLPITFRRVLTELILNAFALRPPPAPAPPAALGANAAVDPNDRNHFMYSAVLRRRCVPYALLEGRRQDCVQLHQR